MVVMNDLDLAAAIAVEYGVVDDLGRVRLVEDELHDVDAGDLVMRWVTPWEPVDHPEGSEPAVG